MDESSKDERTITRLYGYSKINSRALKKVTFIRGKRYTLLPALTEQGIIAVDIMEGSCTKQRFKEFVISQVVSIILYNIKFSYYLLYLIFISKYYFIIYIIATTNEFFSK